jgi:Na+/H+ antiporter
MIIECPACSKKFNIDEKLIQDEGRLLKCGNCDHTWFFKKDENIKLEAETTKLNEINQNKSEFNTGPVEEPIKQKKKIRKKIPKKSSTKESTSKELVSIEKSSVSRENNIIKKIFLIIISIIAFILLIDTFKNQISVIFPGILKMSDSLYLVINDLKLFIKDFTQVKMIQIITKPFRWFFKLEAASGFGLTFAAIIALIGKKSNLSELYFSTLNKYLFF